MKKRDVRRFLSCFACAILGFFCQFAFFSCKSSQAMPEVALLDCTDYSAPLVVQIPVQRNIDFVGQIFSAVSKLDEKSVLMISKRTECIVISASKDGFCGAAQGNFPKAGIKRALSQKNGWERTVSKNTEFPFECHSSSGMKITVSSPDSRLLFFGKNIDGLLENYEACLFSAAETADGEIKNYFLQDTLNDIRFFSSEPSYFLNAFLGKNVSMPAVKNIRGKLSQSKAENSFSLHLDIKLSGAGTAKAAAKMLKMAMFPIPAKIEISGSDSITVSDIQLSYSQLSKLLGIRL